MSRATRTAEILAAARLVPAEIAREQEQTRRASATSQALASLVPALIQGGVDIYGAVGKEQRAQDLLGLQEKKIDAGITAASAKGVSAASVAKQKADNEASRIELAEAKRKADEEKARIAAADRANKLATRAIELGAGAGAGDVVRLPYNDAPADRKVVATFNGESPLESLEQVRTKTKTGLTLDELAAVTDEVAAKKKAAVVDASKREADATVAQEKAADAEAFTPEQRKRAQADNLRKEYWSRKPVLKAEGSRAAFEELSDLVNQNPSAGADLAIVYSFMRTLDPASSVKDAEFDLAAKAEGVPERVLGLVEKALSGQFLTAEQRQDLLKQGGRLSAANARVADGVKRQYETLARRAGFDPVDVVGSNGTPPPPAAVAVPAPTQAEMSAADEEAARYGAKKK